MTEPWVRREELAPGVVIYQGDCHAILPTLRRAEACITDPPYGIGFAARPTRYQRANGMTARAWDDLKPDLTLVLAAAKKVVIWGGNYFPLPPSRGWLAWTKTGNAPSMADLELAWTSVDMNARRFEKTVKSASLEKALAVLPHPSQKPVELMKWCIDQIDVRPGRVVIDPYMGSGSTGVAAAKSGRLFVGIEIDPGYYAIAKQRILEALAAPDMFVAPPSASAVEIQMELPRCPRITST
jgi:DNA modification methylase